MNRLSIPLTAFLLGAALLAGGCRSSGRQELLERDLRHQEDRIYQLETHLNECQQWLEAMQAENEDLRDQVEKGTPAPKASSRRGNGAASSVAPADRVPPYAGPPQISPPNPAVPDGKLPEMVAPPSVELPDLSPPKSTPKAPTPRINEQGSVEGNSVKGGSVEQAEQGEVAAITLNGALTGGYNADAQPGDEGVMVVIEPHGPGGEVVAVPAKVSVVAMDPSLEGDAARIARWNFTTEQAAGHAKKTAQATGLHFNLVWPQEPPQHKSLKLFVRYITPDGRKLDAEQAIEIEPPPRQARAWIRSVNPTPVEAQPGEPPSVYQRRPQPPQRSAMLPPRAGQWSPYR